MSDRSPSDEESGASTPATPSSREKILDTAEALFARSGFSGVGMRTVSEQVGLGKSSLFYHFSSKVKLYCAVLERALEDFVARLDEARVQDMPPVERLHTWVDGVVTALAEHPSWARLLLRSLFEEDIADEHDQQRIDTLFESIVSRLSRALEEGIRSGEIRPVSIPHTIQTLIGMTLFHFASGDLGEDLLGESVFEPKQIQLRREHIRHYLDHVLRTSPRT